MRHLKALFVAALVALVVPGAARAWPHAPPAGIEVHNPTPFDVRVTVDGSFRGGVRAGDERGFGVWPGLRRVLVSAEHDGMVLLDATVDVRPGTTQAVVVPLPTVKLSLVNDGEAPLFVQLSGERAGLWMLPGAVHHTERPIGPLTVTTSLYTWEGLVPLESRALHLVPGRPLRESIGFAPRAALGRVTLTNLERVPVSVWVDGQRLVTLNPRETRAVEVAPGRHLVAVIDAGGRLLYQSPAVLSPRTTYDVTFQGGVTVVPQRPGVAWGR